MSGLLARVSTVNDEASDDHETAEARLHQHLGSLLVDLSRALNALVVHETERPNETRCLTAGQVAEILGIPGSHVRELGRQGRLPVIRLGKYVRFPSDGVEEFVRENTEVRPDGHRVLGSRGASRSTRVRRAG